MKKLLFLFALVIGLANTLSAQMKEGKIVYERKINMWKMITDPEMRTRIPEFRTSQFELMFNDQASLFRTVPDDEAPDPFANSGGGERGGQRFMFRVPETAVYTNLVNQVQYESRAMFEKTFLIIDTLKMLNWKVSEETKTIAKHLCKKATTSVPMQAISMRIGGRPGGRSNNSDSAAKASTTPKETTVTVWYTEEIPASIGPDNFNGLPGAILEVDMDNGANVTTASEIVSKYAKKELVEPTKGDKMNKAQFQEAMKKIMEDMQKAGGFRVRTNN